MNKEFRTIVVDNDSKEVVGKVTFLHSFSMNLQDNILILDTIHELLDTANAHNVTIFYTLGGVRVPLNEQTHDKQHYLHPVGWWNLTPAEAVIFSVLHQENLTQNGWVSTKQLEEMLKAFGFTPTSLRMLLAKLRKKLAESTSYRVENQSKVGYRLTDTANDPINVFLTKESRANSDYWIICNDDKLNHITIERSNLHTITIQHRLTGSQILQGWQGLTRTESEIFFELVKHRGEWVSYEHLLKLPWATRNQREQGLMEKYLQNFMGKIRRKVTGADEVILTEYKLGYCLT